MISRHNRAPTCNFLSTMGGKFPEIQLCDSEVTGIHADVAHVLPGMCNSVSV